MEELNERGNRVEKYFFPVDRTYFDNKQKASGGWKQYETDKDAWHFGIWIYTARRQIVTFNRGDITRIYCASEESFRAEIDELDEKYGAAEPAKMQL
jgi:uncharacterized protein YcaQ